MADSTDYSNNGTSVKVSFLLPQGFKPDEDSVIIGMRGKKVKSHMGNIRFRELLESELMAYATAGGKTEKTYVVNRVLHTIRKWNPSKRAGFVRKDAMNEGRWYSIQDSKARSAVAQAFRDALGIAGQYKSSKESKQAKRKQTINGNGKQLDTVQAGCHNGVGATAYPVVPMAQMAPRQFQTAPMNNMSSHPGPGFMGGASPQAFMYQQNQQQLSGCQKLAHIRTMVQGMPSFIQQQEAAYGVNMWNNNSEPEAEHNPHQEEALEDFDFEPIPLDEDEEQHLEHPAPACQCICSSTGTTCMVPMSMPNHTYSLKEAMFAQSVLQAQPVTRVVTAGAGNCWDTVMMRNNGDDAFAASEQSSLFFLNKGPNF